MADHWPRRRHSLLAVSAFFTIARALRWALGIAFPPEPVQFLHQFTPWRLSLGRAVAPFRAFIARARSHVTFSGSGFHLDTIARVF